MYAYLLLSHGEYAAYLKQSIEMILGPREEMLTFCLKETESASDFQLRLSESLNALQQYDGLFIFTDLYGGTPCNCALRACLGYKNVHLFSGMNSPMVLSVLLDSSLSPEDIIRHGREGIIDVLELAQNQNDSECEFM